MRVVLACHQRPTDTGSVETEGTRLRGVLACHQRSTDAGSVGAGGLVETPKRDDQAEKVESLSRVVDWHEIVV